MAGSKPLGSTAASLLVSDEVVPLTEAPSFIALRRHCGKKGCCAMPRPSPLLAQNLCTLLVKRAAAMSNRRVHKRIKQKPHK